MRDMFFKICLVVLALFFIGCSSKNERMLNGKWSLAGRMIGGSPTSFWFKGGGDVVAPWEHRRNAMESTGTYEFIDDTHLKIKMENGYYGGNVYFFEIIKLGKDELILRTNYQEVKMKKVS